MNRTLIEAARTILADSLLPTTFWAEAVNTACYIFNRVRVTKPQNKTPYELLFGHKPMISYIRPFGCHVTILDTLSVLGKFDASQHADPDDSDMPELEIFNRPKQGIFDAASYNEEGMVTDFNNLPIEVAVSPIPTLRIHNIHPQSQILGDPKSSVQTRSRVQQHSGAHALVSYVQKQQRNNHKDQQHCLFACFLSQKEPKNISEALKDGFWLYSKVLE
ncbi:retrovirus-related pol polyprotein from transposon TNT 1-94 [Tanacetum coccineum]